MLFRNRSAFCMRYVAVKLRTLIINIDGVLLTKFPLKGKYTSRPLLVISLMVSLFLPAILSRTLPINLVLDLVLQFKFKFGLVTANFYCVLVPAVPRYTTRNYEAANFLLLSVHNQDYFIPA